MEVVLGDVRLEKDCGVVFSYYRLRMMMIAVVAVAVDPAHLLFQETSCGQLYVPAHVSATLYLRHPKFCHLQTLSRVVDFVRDFCVSYCFLSLLLYPIHHSRY
jgi:hypothetical protein